MKKEGFSRRDFYKLSTAAFGGMVVGSAACASAQDGEAEGAKKEGGKKGGDGEKPKVSVDPVLLVMEPHVCRGLNQCKTKGAKGENACAGQGACAAVEKHSCVGQNDCKGQGGCGGYPGQNTCKGKGHCAVPLGDEAWSLARKQFEQLMKELDKKVGDAPSKG